MKPVGGASREGPGQRREGVELSANDSERGAWPRAQPPNARPPVRALGGASLHLPPIGSGGSGTAPNERRRGAWSGGTAGRGGQTAPPPPALRSPPPLPARRSRSGAPSADMAACGGLSIQLLLEAADYLERRERGIAGSPPGPARCPLRRARCDRRPRLCLRRSRARLRLAAARREGRGGPAAPSQGQEERRRQQVPAGGPAPGAAAAGRTRRAPRGRSGHCGTG